MAKIKTAFFCNNCGYESAKWVGKCPSCQQWNTFSEEVVEKNSTTTTENWQSFNEQNGGATQNKAVQLQQITENKEPRLLSNDVELNRVMGGGIVPGSITLVAGEPGIGKSTLFLQVGLEITNKLVLYISGEESQQQVKMRALRIGQAHNNFYLLTETSTQQIFKEIKKLKPELVIVDSIQTLQSNLIESAAGTVSQIKECTAELLQFAKQTQTPVILIGHITKDGTVAGPKVLEHMVDVVLQFEGDRHYAYRILRTLKNRFGSSQEIGIYEMNSTGMRPVLNPSEILINQKPQHLSGSSIAAIMEGMRPLLIEVQALVTPSVYGTPQRTSSGFDMRRLQLLLAVLEKRGGFLFGGKDVFLNIAGGLKVEDTSTDLSVIMALLSSYEDVALPMQYCFAGEVGLSGEIRAIARLEQRIAEAEKLGFEKIFISTYNNSKAFDKNKSKIQIIACSTVEEVYKACF
jgi:DNA repair protein RadA/Sms